MSGPLTDGINEEALAQVLEAVCQLGCQAVDQVIDELAQGRVPEPLQALNSLEIKCIQSELIEVMKPLKRS